MKAKNTALTSEMQLHILSVRDIAAAFEFKAWRRMWCICICWFGVILDVSTLQMLFLPRELLYGPEICCSKHCRFGKRILSHSKGGTKDAFMAQKLKTCLRSHRWIPNLTQNWQSCTLLKGQSARVLPAVPKDSRCSCLAYCWGCPAVLWDLLTIGYEWELGHPAHLSLSTWLWSWISWLVS